MKWTHIFKKKIFIGLIFVVTFDTFIEISIGYQLLELDLSELNIPWHHFWWSKVLTTAWILLLLITALLPLVQWELRLSEKWIEHGFKKNYSIFRYDTSQEQHKFTELLQMNTNYSIHFFYDSSFVFHINYNQLIGHRIETVWKIMIFYVRIEIGHVIHKMAENWKTKEKKYFEDSSSFTFLIEYDFQHF